MANLTNTVIAIAQQYLYSAYGEMLSAAHLQTAATALTSLLYSGEWTQANGTQYLRARFYDPSSGRFNRLDPFAGNQNDPQSLHKYLYTHGNPVMGIDPSGELSLILTLVRLAKGSGSRAFKIELARRARNAALEGVVNIMIGLGVRAFMNPEKVTDRAEIVADFAGGFASGLVGGGGKQLSRRLVKSVGSRVGAAVLAAAIRMGAASLAAMFGTAVEMYTESLVSGEPVDKEKMQYRILASGFFGFAFKSGEEVFSSLGKYLDEMGSPLSKAAKKELQVLQKRYNKKLKKGDYWGQVVDAGDIVTAEVARKFAFGSQAIGYLFRLTGNADAMQLSETLSDAVGEELINKM